MCGFALGITAAGALVKLFKVLPSLASISTIPLMSAIKVEPGEQVRQYMLKALLPGAQYLNVITGE